MAKERVLIIRVLVSNVFKNRVVSNAAWIIGCRVIQSLLSLVIGMLTARYLGPAKFGLINYAASLTAFFLPFMQLGLNSILVQEIIDKPEEEGKTIGTSIVLCLCSSVLCIAGIFSFSLIANANEKDTIIICVLYSTILIFQAIEMIRYWFQAKLKSKYISIVMLAAYLVVSVYRIFLLVTGKSVYWFAFVNAFDSVLIAISLMIIYKKLGGQRLRFSFSSAKKMLGRSHYFIISSLMITVFAQTDKIMLKLMLGEEETGLYSAAVTCASYLGFVFTAILDSSRPSILESKKTDNSIFENKVTQLYTIVVYLSVAQCIAMTVFPKQIIGILYGEEFFAAAGVLMLVVWYITFSYIGGVRSIWILAENLQKYLWIINLAGAVANVILNAVMIPVLGMYGAALTSIITQMFINVFIGFIIRPLRRSNLLLFKGLNPKNVVDILGKLKRK